MENIVKLTASEFMIKLEKGNLPDEYMVEDDVFLFQTFENEVNLNRGFFVRKFNCGNAVFKKNLNCGSAIFRNSFTTYDAIFKKKILCSHAKFEGYFSYQPRNISQGVDLGSCSIFKARKLA